MRRHDERGMVLMATLMVMMLMAGLLVGFYALVTADQNSSGVNRDQTQAYSAAHAGLEKLTADVGQVFEANYSPTMAQLTALTGNPPNVGSQFSYTAPDNTSGYRISALTPLDGTGRPTPLDPVNGTPIVKGAFQGLIGLITPYQIDVIARSAGGSEIQMRREFQTVAVPVFQFGIFSENDLSFFAGPDFNFGGRVHGNQNIYLAQDSGGTLTLEDRITAVGEVIRTHLANGLQASSANGYQGTVRVARAPSVYRNLTQSPNDGSVNVSTVPPSVQTTDADGNIIMQLTSGNTANEPRWTGTLYPAYNGYLRNGRTGVRRLDLPIVSDGASPIDLIRRPPLAAEPAVVTAQRFYSMASLRILLSDRAADIMGLPGIDAAFQPMSLENMVDLYARGYVNGAATPRLAISTGAGSYRTPNNTSLVGGFIKMERQDNNGVWSDVTAEILNLGFAGRNLSNGTWGTADTNICSPLGDASPDAVIRLQRLKDNPAAGAMSPTNPAIRCGNGSATPSDYIPNVLYDPREGTRRDDEPTENALNPHFGGIIHYVELDVNNLRRWFAGQIGATGNNNTMNVTGYVVYFSDRRTNKDAGADNNPSTPEGADGLLGTADDYGDDRETGELGFEDFINPASGQSVPNNTLDTGEDMNGDGVLQTYGNRIRYLTGSAGAFGAVGSVLSTQITATEARLNRAVFFRRALKLVHAKRGQLPSNANQGLTVASENPVYIEGNFNACLPADAAGACTGAFGATGDGHVSAAVIADAVTLLSNQFTDLKSFISWHHVNNASRTASTNAWYRLGIIAGKGLNFPHPTSNAQDHKDFGTDGGAHNFLRYIEKWDQTLNYRGSIISFYTSRQAVGAYKCCDVVYDPPARGYRFDAEFLSPNLLPPRTPMFRDINALSFRQILRPTQ